MNYCFPEPGVYNFSDAITHLTYLAELTVYTRNLTQNFEFFMQLEKLLDIDQTLVINCSNKIQHLVEYNFVTSNLLINFVSEERSMYVQIACNKNQLIFGFQFDQLTAGPIIYRKR